MHQDEILSQKFYNVFESVSDLLFKPLNDAVNIRLRDEAWLTDSIGDWQESSVLTVYFADLSYNYIVELPVINV